MPELAALAVEPAGTPARRGGIATRVRKRGRVGGVVLLGLHLLGTAACERITGPDYPAGAVPFDPPARYRLWWEMAQACSGVTGELGAVRWYHVPGASYLPLGNRLGVTGIWYRRTNAIVLAGSYEAQPPVVRHEMLHALIRADGHPRELFQSACGGIVSCGSECRSDGGAPVPAADAAAVAAGELQYEMELLPTAQSFAADSGVLAIVLSATNPLDRAVRVQTQANSFAVRIDELDGSTLFYGKARRVPDDTYFDAGQRRRYAFDVVLPVGTVVVRGFFAGAPFAPVDYRVTP